MHPVAFHVGNFTIHWFGVMVALGFVVGLGLAARRGMLIRLRPEWIADLGVPLLVGTLVGARGFYVLTYWKEQFAGEPWWHVFAIRQGGLVFYGGLVGATLAGAGYVLFRRWPLWKICDALAPSVPLGFAIGRIGCLLNGCCYGRACDLPWAVRFPRDSFAWREQVEAGLTTATGPSLPVHPTQVYDALWGVALWLALAWLFRRRKFDGQVFALLLAGYAILRSLGEIFRGDYGPAQRLGPLTPAQLFSVAVVATAALLYYLLRRAGGKPAAPPAK